MNDVKERLHSRYMLWQRRLRPQIKELRLALYTLSKNKVGLCGLGVVIFFIFIGIFGSYLAPHKYDAIDLSVTFQPPSLAHPFGTDELGRDIFSRVLSGAQFSLTTGIIVVSIALPLGSILGVFAGFIGGKWEHLVMRVVDIFMAFPSLILAMAFCAALGPSLQNVTFSVALVSWQYYARLMHAQALTIKERSFNQAARAMGASRWYVALHHVLPNTIAPAIVKASMDIADIIMWTAGLSFLGFGAQPPIPEWGKMISDGRIYILRSWWIVAFPGLMIFLVILGFNLFGDALRDLLDPKTRRMMEVVR